MCGLVSPLRPTDEEEVRRAASTTGAPLNTHFKEFAASRWRAVKLPAEYDDLFLGEPPTFLQAPEKYLTAFGVDTEKIQSIDDVIPDIMREDASARAPAASSAAAAAVDAVAPRNVRLQAGEAMAAARYGEAHLRSLCIERGQGQGAAAHTYGPETMLQALLISATVRRGSGLDDILSWLRAPPFFFGSIASVPLQGALRDGSSQLPQASVLRDAQIRLDILEMARQRSIGGACGDLEVSRHRCLLSLRT